MSQLLLCDQKKEFSIEDIRKMVELSRKHKPNTILFPWPEPMLIPFPKGWDKESFNKVVEEMKEIAQKSGLIIPKPCIQALRGKSRDAIVYDDSNFNAAETPID